MKNIPTFEEFVNESNVVKLDKNIIDSRGRYDVSEYIHDEVNKIANIVKKAFTKKGEKIEKIELTSGNKYDGYQLRIKTDKSEMVVNVNFGKVGLEDHREGYIDIRYSTKQIEVRKNSRGFGDVHINVDAQKKDIENAIKSIIR